MYHSFCQCCEKENWFFVVPLTRNDVMKVLNVSVSTFHSFARFNCWQSFPITPYTVAISYRPFENSFFYQNFTLKNGIKNKMQYVPLSSLVSCKATDSLRIISTFFFFPKHRSNLYRRHVLFAWQNHHLNPHLIDFNCRYSLIDDGSLYLWLLWFIRICISKRIIEVFDDWLNL